MKAHQSLGSGQFRGEAKASTWLYRVTVNQALSRLRSRRRFFGLFGGGEDAEAGNDEPVAGGSPELSVVLGEMRARLGELPVEQRTALVLTQLEGHSNAEAARLLGCSEGAIEQRLVRARAKLREGDVDAD